MRIGIGYDSHRLVEKRKLIIGGVDIPFEKGLIGHSDADVLCHALMDAVIGALGLGDIGPFRKSFAPPPVIFGNGMVLRQIEGDGPDGSASMHIRSG